MPVKDYPSSDRPAWRLVAEEFLAASAAGLLYPFGLAQERRRTPRKEHQRTVVLVHGYLANRSTLMPLAWYLRLHGHRQLLFFNYRSVDGAEQAARALKTFLKRRVGGGRIDLVCHSMGGVVARIYLQELGGARRVDRCVTLCTPHRGTYSSYWMPTRVGNELRPDSALVNRLEESAKHAETVQFLSIAAGSDNIIVPRVFSAHNEEICIPHKGHLGVLFSREVFRRVHDFLRG